MRPFPSCGRGPLRTGGARFRSRRDAHSGDRGLPARRRAGPRGRCAARPAARRVRTTADTASALAFDCDHTARQQTRNVRLSRWHRSPGTGSVPASPRTSTGMCRWPMRDGTVLRADVWIPDRAERRARAARTYALRQVRLGGHDRRGRAGPAPRSGCGVRRRHPGHARPLRLRRSRSIRTSTSCATVSTPSSGAPSSRSATVEWACSARRISARHNCLPPPRRRPGAAGSGAHDHRIGFLRGLDVSGRRLSARLCPALGPADPRSRPHRAFALRRAHTSTRRRSRNAARSVADLRAPARVRPRWPRGSAAVLSRLAEARHAGRVLDGGRAKGVVCGDLHAGTAHRRLVRPLHRGHDREFHWPPARRRNCGRTRGPAPTRRSLGTREFQRHDR